MLRQVPVDGPSFESFDIGRLPFVENLRQNSIRDGDGGSLAAESIPVWARANLAYGTAVRGECEAKPKAGKVPDLADAGVEQKLS